MRKLSKIISLFLFTSAMSFSFISIPGSIAQNHSPSNSNPSEKFPSRWQEFLDDNPPPPESERRGGQRGGLICLIAPLNLIESAEIWSLQPIFVWQGTVNRVEVYPVGNEEPLWSQAVQDEDRMTPYTGTPLTPGVKYEVALFGKTSPLEIIPNIQQVTFQVMNGEKRDRITKDLEALEKRLKNQGATEEYSAYARAKFFAERKLWADALAQSYSIKEPSPDLKKFRQNLAQNFCI